MLWEVSGADRKTGREIKLTVAADSERAALGDEKVRGILVSEVKAKPALPARPTRAAGPIVKDKLASLGKWIEVTAVLLGAISLLLFLGMALFFFLAVKSETEAERSSALGMAIATAVAAAFMASWSLLTRFIVAAVMQQRAAAI